MSFVIDLDAERREVQHPHGITVLLKGQQFLFPAEVPADALDPLLSDELDLVGLLSDIVGTKGATVSGEVIELLFKRPKLPRQFLTAVKDIYRILLGDEGFADFVVVRPSIGDYVRLTKALITVYGVDLGNLFGSGDSSESDGETSSPTSAGSTDSTPGASGSGQDSPDSSASAA
ncbi:hypothetical protein OHS33_38675 (plasmid) [Streptomyces sp. NBC_00536]|uniref:hypothetical protein n=1 Tax=Streptomyces sp. NBC_00536 TaxID=2975769 RepID=UPI002E81DF01|nr:hypothetical protein [Streptomyces sp. NBC_00536]WUC84428.1 hypothetical protein OHS33_38675 [Streptomyces sp. NBC_00536]